MSTSPWASTVALPTTSTMRIATTSLPRVTYPDCGIIAAAFPTMNVSTAEDGTACCRLNVGDATTTRRILCDQGMRVYSVQFDGTRITGRFPQLTNLTSLQTLSLARNRLTGSLPIDLPQLRRLTTLILSQNNLNGTLGPLGSMNLRRDGG
ncbi:hypothetical protein BC829DRAFT_141793 [Chytridium lagenaria]|nr:hypothetical protein BC829DRAFT_141793 [Chytridium lagenaria]